MLSKYFLGLVEGWSDLKFFAGELYHNLAHFAVTVWREWTQVICGYSLIEGMW